MKKSILWEGNTLIDQKINPRKLERIFLENLKLLKKKIKISEQKLKKKSIFQTIFKKSKNFLLHNSLQKLQLLRRSIYKKINYKN